MMLHLGILRKIQLFVIIRSAWALAETQTADILKTSVPKLNVSEACIDMKVNSVLYLQCKGEFPLFWTYVDPMIEDDDQDISHLSTGNPTPDGYASTIRLEFKSAYQTGRYVCYHGNHNTSLYIFVDDGKHLLLPIEINAIIFHEGRSDVIRCLPTVSKAEISLWKYKQPAKEMVPLSNTLEYDPTMGFKVKYPTDYFQRSFSCVAEYENRTDSIWLDIETLAATQQIPEIYIDARGTEYVLLDTNISMICVIKVEISTMIGEPRWAYPVSDPKRIVLSDYTITTIKEEKIVRQKLTILNAQKEDEGFYQCNVTDHSNKTNYYEVKINIYEQAQKPVVNFSKSSEVIIKERGVDAKLVASYTIFPHSADIGVVWTKDTNQSLLDLKKYKSKTTDSKFILRIFNLTKADSGLYTVKAQAPGGSNQMSFRLHVSDKPEVKIINVTGCCYTPGENYEILCQSEAYPPPVLYWSWKPVCRHLECSGSDEWEVIEDYHEVNNSTVWLTNSNGDLFSSVMFLTAQKSGFYKCSSKNEKGIAEDQTPFIVSDIESGFQIYYDEIEPLETSPFSLTCRASSDLFTGLHWRWTPYGQSESIPYYSGKTEKLNSSNSIGISLEIASIKLSDAGEYLCVAEKRNGKSSEEKSVLINVKEIKEPYFVKPEWNVSEMVLPPNSVLTLECFVNGTPEPKVTWYRNGEIFTENTTGGKFEDNYQKLLIGRLMKEDSGEYECRAENIAGEIMQKTMLVVEDEAQASAQLQDSGPKQVMFLVVASIGAVAMILLLLLLGRWLYRRKKIQVKMEGFNPRLFQEGQMCLYNPNLSLDEQADLLPYDDKWEFPKEKLKLGRTVGQGAFGRVVKAEAFGINDFETSTPVAVKMLKEQADVNQLKALMAELKILIQLGHHVNIVNLMGAVTKNIAEGEVYVIVEYCRYGNLRNYLLRHRDKFINELDELTGKVIPTMIDYITDNLELVECEVKFDPARSSAVFAVDNPSYRPKVYKVSSYDSKVSSSGRTASCSTTCSSGSSTAFRNYDRIDSHDHAITTSDLLCYAFQCARGMDYLASRKLIHRDLAARNVLLADDKIVKICDFGLAKDCYKYENYIKKGDGPLPIKWMAIESIWDHIFTTKSDVWSFGILMWEFFTLGGNPYPGIEIDEEFYKKLKAGYRMGKPEFCPDEIYQIMQNCWSACPDSRPDFDDISVAIGDLLEAGVKQHYLDVNTPYIEMNRKMLNHDYFNLQTAQNQGQCHIYINSEICNHALNDNTIALSKEFSSKATSKDKTELNFSTFLDTITEDEVMRTKTIEEQRNKARHVDYLLMAES